ncbi:MAG TPA: heavy metal translocating P-type ATPase [Thermoplasmata archaeon]|nr:heavy metal translocating P-type ATPase [Thermoplasmata archaeon]
MATDPVCGMFVDERAAPLKLARDNRTYYFCSSGCLRRFAQPERELARLRLRLAIAWPLALAVVALTYLAPFAGWPWAALVLAGVVQFFPGLEFYRGTYDAVRARAWNMDVLIAVGTTVAFADSAVVLVLGRGGPFYFDAAAAIVTLILTGNYLERLVRDRASGAVRALGELLPARASVVRGDAERALPLAEVEVGDLVRVRPGGRFPVDGAIRDGRTSVDERLVTGEGLPVPKGPGDAVVAGSVNGEGVVLVRATRVGADTFLAQVGSLLAEAETSRVPLQRLADRLAAVFVPFVLALAVVGALAWYAAGGANGPLAMLVFVSVVITACPCAFGLATPAAILVGTGRAADAGILFRGSDALERASEIDVVVTDKTGTITRGRPTLRELVPVPGESGPAVLALAAGLEIGSEHPLARAVGEAAAAQGVAPGAVEAIAADPGRGVRGRSAGAPVAVLTGEAAAADGTDLGPLVPAARAIEAAGRAWSVVVRDGRAIGLIGFEDELAPGVVEAVAALRADGIDVVVASGDGEPAVRRAASQAGIRRFHARMAPAAKRALLQRLRAEGHRVAYVGDGINDAPALAEADLGIALGTGTEVAKEAGNVLLVRPDFRGVALALRIGRRTVRKVRGNLAWALGYNAVLLPIALGALVPLFGLAVFRVLPFTGAIAMAISSTSVLLNSYSLRWVSLAPSAGRPATAAVWGRISPPA